MVVQQCTLPDLDVLLPYNGSTGHEGRFFLVAIADSQGAEVLAKRLREQLRRWEEREQTGTTFEVTYKFLPLTMPAQKISGDNLLPIISRNLEQLISDELLKRSASEERNCG